MVYDASIEVDKNVLTVHDVYQEPGVARIRKQMNLERNYFEVRVLYKMKCKP